jgi:hypothetical protein
VSYEHINHVRDHSKTRGPARLVLLTIATRTDEEGYAFPSYTCLAKDTGMTIRSIRRALEEIPAAELVIAQHGKSHRAALYRVTITDSPGQSNTNSLCAPIAHENPNTGSNNNSLCAPGAHKETQDETLCAPIAHEDVNQKFTENLCAHTDTSLCANEHTLCARTGNLCAPIAHPTVIEHSKEEQSGNSQSSELKSATDFYFLSEQQKKEKSRFALTPKQEKPKPAPQGIETKEQLVARLTEEFAATVDVQAAATTYEQHLADTGKYWKNGRFVQIVTELHRKVRP